MNKKKLNYRWKLLPVVFFLLFSFLTVQNCSFVFADRGMVSTASNVSIYEPGQKAIIAWSGMTEVLILSTDVYASEDTVVLEILPLPSNPRSIEEGSFDSFIEVSRQINEHAPKSTWGGNSMAVENSRGGGFTIVFHQKINSHNITVVKSTDASALIGLAEEFLQDNGIEHSISSTKLKNLIEAYIKEKIEFFVFDLIELSSEKRSHDPIVYIFDSFCLYFPLKISSIVGGFTEITLFTLTDNRISKDSLPSGMEFGRYYYYQNGKPQQEPIQIWLRKGDLEAIDSRVSQLFGYGTWLSVIKYLGLQQNLNWDLKIYASIDVESTLIILVIILIVGGLALILINKKFERLSEKPMNTQHNQHTTVPG